MFRQHDLTVPVRVSGGMQLFLLLFDFRVMLTGKVKEDILVMYTGPVRVRNPVMIGLRIFRAPATGAQFMYLRTPILTSRKDRLQTSDNSQTTLDRNTIG